MKRNAWIALMLACLVFMSACSSNKSAASTEAYDTYETAPAEAPAAMEYSMVSAASGSAFQEEANRPEPDKIQQDAGIRKIVYNANLDLTADDPAAALRDVEAKAKALGGYLADSYTTTDDLGASHCSATLKVPADRLEELVSAAEGMGKVTSYQLSSDDISLSYYDIEARLKSAKAEEEQLTAILKDCKTVEEVLSVRESLSRVRSDIESYQGQINLWDNLVSYATLQLSVRRTQRAAVEGEAEPIAIWKASDVFKKMSLGFTNSARFVVNAVGAIGIFLAYVILPAAVLSAIVYGVIVLKRKTAPARAAQKQARREKREQRVKEKAARKSAKKNE